MCISVELKYTFDVIQKPIHDGISKLQEEEAISRKLAIYCMLLAINSNDKA